MPILSVRSDSATSLIFLLESQTGISIPFDRAVLLYGLPNDIIVPVGLAIYHRSKRKNTK